MYAIESDNNATTHQLKKGGITLLIIQVAIITLVQATGAMLMKVSKIYLKTYPRIDLKDISYGHSNSYLKM